MANTTSPKMQLTKQNIYESLHLLPIEEVRQTWLGQEPRFAHSMFSLLNGWHKDVPGWFLEIVKNLYYDEVRFPQVLRSTPLWVEDSYWDQVAVAFLFFLLEKMKEENLNNEFGYVDSMLSFLKQEDGSKGRVLSQITAVVNGGIGPEGWESLWASEVCEILIALKCGDDANFQPQIAIITSHLSQKLELEKVREYIKNINDDEDNDYIEQEVADVGYYARRDAKREFEKEIYDFFIGLFSE